MARGRATDTTALVAAAAETFHRKGYRNSTIDDIAEAAGISRPTVYKYTRSKQHLLDLMVDHITADMSRRIKEVVETGEPPHARLRALIATHVDSAVENRTFYAIVFSEQVELSDYGRTAFRGWAHQTTRDFRVLLDECLPDDTAVDTTVAANLVLSLLSNVYRWYDPAGPVSPPALVDQIEMVLGSLFAPTGVRA